MLTAARVWVPLSPNTSLIKSDAPLITFGCSIKSSVELTKPVNLIHDLIFDKKKVIYFNNIKDACKNSDLLIIHTEWNEFKQLNFNRLKNKKKFKIYDLRNLYSTKKMKNKNIDYFSIGR